MALRLEFPDKYQLWSELVRGHTDRLFVAAVELPRLGELVPIELLVGAAAPVVVVGNAQVVALRRRSRLFKTGVWVRFDDEEVEKVRRVLGLNQNERPKPGRRSRRLPCTLPVKLLRPQRQGCAGDGAGVEAAPGGARRADARAGWGPKPVALGELLNLVGEYLQP